jgi:hypothetical protein
MTTSPYPTKTNTRLLCTLMGFQLGKTKCLTQTWNRSKSLYAINTFNAMQSRVMVGFKATIMNMVNSEIAKSKIYESTIWYRHLRLSLLSTIQFTVLRRDSLESNQNRNLTESRIKPSFQHILGRSCLKYLQHIWQPFYSHHFSTSTNERGWFSSILVDSLHSLPKKGY